MVLKYFLKAGIEFNSKLYLFWVKTHGYVLCFIFNWQFVSIFIQFWRILIVKMYAKFCSNFEGIVFESWKQWNCQENIELVSLSAFIGIYEPHYEDFGQVLLLHVLGLAIYSDP